MACAGHFPPGRRYAPWVAPRPECKRSWTRQLAGRARLTRPRGGPSWSSWATATSEQRTSPTSCPRWRWPVRRLCPPCVDCGECCPTQLLWVSSAMYWPTCGACHVKRSVEGRLTLPRWRVPYVWLCPPAIDPRVAWAMATRGLRELAAGGVGAQHLLRSAACTVGLYRHASACALFWNGVVHRHEELADRVISAGPGVRHG